MMRLRMLGVAVAFLLGGLAQARECGLITVGRFGGGLYDDSGGGECRAGYGCGDSD